MGDGKKKKGGRQIAKMLNTLWLELTNCKVFVFYAEEKCRSALISRTFEVLRTRRIFWSEAIAFEWRPVGSFLLMCFEWELFGDLQIGYKEYESRASLAPTHWGRHYVRTRRRKRTEELGLD